MRFAKIATVFQVLGLLISLVGGIGLAELGYNARGPEFQISQIVKNLGDVEPGQRLDAEIPFKNVGAAPLVFKAIATSCGCTHAQVTPEVVPPGAEGKIVVQLQTARYEMPIDETIDLETNDVHRQITTVHIVAKVVTPLRLFPLNFDFGVVRQEDLPISATVRAESGEDTIKISDLHWSLEQYGDVVNRLPTSLISESSSAPPESIILTATLPRGAIPGPIFADFRIVGKKNGKVVVSQPITSLGKLLGPVAAIPDNVLWDLNHDQPENRTIVLKIVRGAGTYVAKASPSIAQFLDVRVAGQQITLTLLTTINRINLSRKRVRIAGDIRVKDRDLGSDILSLPVVIIGQ
jgi:hypothetical protein